MCVLPLSHAKVRVPHRIINTTTNDTSITFLTGNITSTLVSTFTVASVILVDANSSSTGHSTSCCHFFIISAGRYRCKGQPFRRYYRLERHSCDNRYTTQLDRVSTLALSHLRQTPPSSTLTRRPFSAPLPREYQKSYKSCCPVLLRGGITIARAAFQGKRWIEQHRFRQHLFVDNRVQINMQMQEKSCVTLLLCWCDCQRSTATGRFCAPCFPAPIPPEVCVCVLRSSCEWVCYICAAYLRSRRVFNFRTSAEIAAITTMMTTKIAYFILWLWLTGTMNSAPVVAKVNHRSHRHAIIQPPADKLKPFGRSSRRW